MTEDGGPAFPRAGFDGPDNGESSQPGMSLRDWFAGMALQGYLSTPTYCMATAEALAALAYTDAGAMLAKRRHEESHNAKRRRIGKRRKAKNVNG